MKEKPSIMRWNTDLVKENVPVVYMHNAILESAFPPALGTSHLSMQEKIYYQKTSIIDMSLVMMYTTDQTKKEKVKNKKSGCLPCQIELKSNAVCSVPLLGPHHPDPRRRRHLHSVVHHRHHLHHHFD